jgi:hypothetical protein
VEISGYIAGVGRSGRLSRVSDTVMRSCDAAVASIVSKVFTEVGIRENSTNYSNESQIHRQSMGNLTEFLVLETWTDPRNGAIYTLAVAKPAN